MFGRREKGEIGEREIKHVVPTCFLVFAQQRRNRPEFQFFEISQLCPFIAS